MLLCRGCCCGTRDKHPKAATTPKNMLWRPPPASTRGDAEGCALPGRERLGQRGGPATHWRPHQEGRYVARGTTHRPVHHRPGGMDHRRRGRAVPAALSGLHFWHVPPRAGHQVDQPKGGSGRPGATAPLRAHRPGLATWRAAAQGSRPSAQSAPADKTPSAYVGGDPAIPGGCATVRRRSGSRGSIGSWLAWWPSCRRGGSGTAKPRCGVPDPPCVRGGRRC